MHGKELLGICRVNIPRQGTQLTRTFLRPPANHRHSRLVLERFCVPCKHGTPLIATCLRSVATGKSNQTIMTHGINTFVAIELTPVRYSMTKRELTHDVKRPATLVAKKQGDIDLGKPACRMVGVPWRRPSRGTSIRASARPGDGCAFSRHILEGWILRRRILG